MNVLRLAAHFGLYGAVRDILQQKSDPIAMTTIDIWPENRWKPMRHAHGITPLLIAAEHGHEQLIQVLLGNKAMVNKSVYTPRPYVLRLGTDTVI
jgi:ankyrin repeat protein